MIFNGKELKAAVHEAAGIKNARIAYDAESRCVIISGDSLRIEIGGVAATEDSWGGAPESFVVPKLAAKYIEALTDGDIAIKVDGDKPREGRQSQGSSERRQGGDPAASERQSFGLHAEHERRSRACEPQDKTRVVGVRPARRDALCGNPTGAGVCGDCGVAAGMDCREDSVNGVCET